MLEERGRSVTEERSTTRSPLADADVYDLLDRAARVSIARGKKTLEHSPSDVDLEQLKGPSGKYRAPMVLAGGTLIVGFNEDVTAHL